MTTPADASPEDNKSELEKKPEPRRRKADAKKAAASASGPEDAIVDSVKAEPSVPSAAKSGGGGRFEKDDPSSTDAGAGTALAPAGTSPVDPFLTAKAEDKVEPPPPPRSFASRMLDYSAHAAIIVGLIGFAWTMSGYVIGQKKGDASVTAAKSSTGKSDELGDLRLANVKLHEELKALRASVESLRATAKRDTTPEQVRVLSAGLDNVKSTLGAARSETNTAIAQLQNKIDKLSPGKMQALADRVGRLEHQSIDTASTGSISRSEASHAEVSRAEGSRPDVSRGDAPRGDTARAAKPASSESAKPAPTPPAKPAELAKLDDTHGGNEETKPQIIPGWTVRDVYQGVALIEGKRGTLEVVPGVSIPGAGVVKSIERKGGGWVVTTSKGQLAYGGAAAQREQRDQRDYRRGGYGGGYGRSYPSYRYDY